MMAKHAMKDPLIHEFIAACPPGGHVLDLGCGPGAYAVLLAEAGLSVDAIDASTEQVVRIPSHTAISARVGTFDTVAGSDIYDGAWASFSLLHAPREALPRHLSAISDALKPGAPFFLGLKRGKGRGRDRLGRYYEYYQRSELETLLEAASLTPQRHWTGFARGLAGHKEGWIVIHANA